MFFLRSSPDGLLTSGQQKHEVELVYLDVYPCSEVFICEDNVFYLTKAEDLNTMSTGEDEPSSKLNGRLRPRKSTTSTPSPQNKTIRKPDGKLAQDRPKRSSTQSKASPSKQDDRAAKSDTLSAPLFLCPYCDRKFYARQTASKHARRIHLSTSKQDNFIKCLYCNHSEAESNSIIKHMVDSHPNQYFACLDCLTRFSSTTELAEHKLNVCEKQKPTYRSKLRQKTSLGTKKNSKKLNKDEKSDSPNENAQYMDDRGFNGIVISCELKPSEAHDEIDIEDKITTNLILPHSKTLGTAGRAKSAVIVLDDLQWNKRIPSNFSFHNTDADQILSRLGVVHRSPRVGESRKDLIRMMDEPNEKFEKCFDTSFYTKVAKNVQDNLTKYLDGSFNFNPNKDNTIKTRKSKTSIVINTAEGFPILLAHEQFSRNLIDGFIPRAIAPKHKWKWDTAENDKNVVMLLDQTKRDSHVNNCIVTLISSLDIWTQLRMKNKFEGIFKTTPTAKKTEKQNIISLELKEILESRDIPSTSSQVVRYDGKPIEMREGSDLAAYLGLSPTTSRCELQPAVLSGEWVRPRCYVCCACGEQTRDARALSAHLTSQHPNAQVQHYEIVGETLLSADILKHLYVPPSQISNRTRPLRGYRDCTKCKKSITLDDLHQHMLDCAGDTPTVRRKCRYRPFGVRRRRTRLPDNTIRKKMRKAISSRHRQKAHNNMRPRPRVRTEVGDAETIRKMIADLPAKRNRISSSNVLRRNIRRNTKQQRHNKTPIKLRAPQDKKINKTRAIKNLRKPNKTGDAKKRNDTDSLSSVDEDDQPLKLSVTRVSLRSTGNKKSSQRRDKLKKTNEKKQDKEIDSDMQGLPPPYYDYEFQQVNNVTNTAFVDHNMRLHNLPPDKSRWPRGFSPGEFPPNVSSQYQPYYISNQMVLVQGNHISPERARQLSFDQAQHANHLVLTQGNRISPERARQLSFEQAQHANHLVLAQTNRISPERARQLSFEQAQHANHMVLAQANQISPEGACQLSFDQAQHSTQLVLAQANRISPERARALSFDQAQHVNHIMALRNVGDNQMKDEICEQIEIQRVLHNKLQKDVAQSYQQVIDQYNQLAQMPQNQVVVDHSNQIIDVYGAGPSNIRQHGNHDEKNQHGSNNIPVREGNDSNQNHNIAQTPNVPLKHSIASLTSKSKLRATAAPYYPLYLMPTNKSETQIQESVDHRQHFENEGTSEKLDKPPLSNYSTEPNKPGGQQCSQNTGYISHDKSEHLPSQDGTVVPYKCDSKQNLPNNLSMFREPDRPVELSNNLMILAAPGGQPSTLFDRKISEELCENVLFPKKSGEPLLLQKSIRSETNQKESTGLNEEQVKTDTDKLKLNKTRKGLNDCIAMLRTKKGLRLNPTTGEYGDDESLDSDLIDPDIPISSASKPLNTCKTSEDNKVDNTINMTPAQVFSRSMVSAQHQENYSDRKTQCVSGDNIRTSLQAGNADIRRKSLYSEYDALISKQLKVKREVSRTRSLSHTDMEKSAHTEVLDTEGSLFLKPSPRQPADIYSENIMKMRRNSVDGMHILDAPFYQHRFAETTKSLMAMNIPNLTQTMLKDRVEEGDGLQDSLRVVNEIHKQQNNYATTIENSSVQVSDVGKLDSMTTQQSVSPNSRRIRRKPIKKVLSEHQPTIIYERNFKQTTNKQTVMSPRCHDSYRRFSGSPKESNSHLVSSNYLPAGSSTEIRPLETPSPQIHKEIHKRVLDASESGASILRYRNDGYQNKLLKKSPETHTDNITLQNIRRHSIESAIAQTSVANNYDILMLQAYRERERNERALLDKSTLTRGSSQSRKTTQSDIIKISVDSNLGYDRSNELRARYPSISTFTSTTPDTHGVLYVNSGLVRNEMVCNTVEPREVQDRLSDHRMRYENEQLARKIQQANTQKQRSNNSESKIDCFIDEIKTSENNISGHESDSTVQKSNVLDNNSRTHGIHRNSCNYYIRSSPYQSNIPNPKINVSDHPLDMVSGESKDTRDLSLRVYQESPSSFVSSTNQNSNNIYSGIPLQPLSCEPNIDMLTPLDLSCDPKIRAERIVDPSDKSPDILKNSRDISIANESTYEESFMMEHQRNYAEQHPNISQHPPGHKLDDESNNEQVHKMVPVALQKTDINKTNEEMLSISRNNMQSQKNIHYTKIDTTATNTELHTSNQRHFCYEGTNNTTSDQLLTTAHDYSTPTELQSCNRMSSYQQSIDEKTHRENEVTQSFQTQDSHTLEAKFQKRSFHKISTHSTNCLDIDGQNPNAEHNTQNEKVLDDNDHTAASNVTTMAVNDQLPDDKLSKSTESNETVPENNQMLADQDPETAQKIAMLPEELVKILGTIPKDHRTQLLKVLPQYVSTTAPVVVNNAPDSSNSTVPSKNCMDLQVEDKHQAAACDDTSKLSVNTGISPSHIIPKKRHSPSHSRGRLNSNETHTPPPVLHPILPQSSELEYEVTSATNVAELQKNENFIEENHLESSVLDYSRLETNKPQEEKKNDDININVVDIVNNNEDHRENEDLTVPATISLPSNFNQDIRLQISSNVRQPNEQTASLRAVRIKSNALRRSLDGETEPETTEDVPNPVEGISLITDQGTGESERKEILNPEQVINPQQPECFKRLSDFHSNKSIYPQIKNEHNSKTFSEAPTSLNPIDNLQDDSNKLGSPKNYDNVVDENNQNTPSQSNSQQSCSHQFYKTNTLDSTDVASQKTKKDVGHFLEQVASTSFSDGDSRKDLTSFDSLSIVSDCSESKDSTSSKSHDYNNCERNITTKLTSGIDVTKCADKLEQVVEIDQKQPSKIMEEKQILPAKPLENKRMQSKNEALLNITSEHKPVPSLECVNDNTDFQSKVLLPKFVSSNEDDSEDDVSLAVIKQKQSVQSIFIQADTNCLEDTEQSKLSFKINNDMRNLEKVVKKKRILKKSGSDKGTESGNDTVVITPLDIELSNKEPKGNPITKIPKTTIANTVISTDKDKVEINEVLEFDVNKENDLADNLIKLIEDDDNSILPGCNVTEHQNDNCVDKNTQNTSENMPTCNMQSETKLQSEDNVLNATQEATCHLHIAAKCESDIEILSKTERKLEMLDCSHKTESVSRDSSDVLDKNVAKIYDLNITSFQNINESKSMVDNVDSKNLSDATIISSFATPEVDEVVTNFQLSSEICEKNTIPLRRSRRGKSLYADASCLDDMEQIVQVEDVSIKTPLTMKRLILSRVEKDKKRVGEYSLFEKRNDTIDETDLPKEKKGRLTKRKKSPCSKRKSKKAKQAIEEKPETKSSDHNDVHCNPEIIDTISYQTNKPEDIDSSMKDVISFDPDRVANLSQNSTSTIIEKICEDVSVSSVEVKESNVPGKRKFNVTKITDPVSLKSKKSKYNKKKSQSSDFDSDDEKVLLETKQKIVSEKQIIEDKVTSSTLLLETPLEKVENSSQLSKNSDEVSTDIPNQIATVEARITCYSRQSSTRRPRLSTASCKDNVDYDPYDIDLEDMVEPSVPIIKKKGKHSSNTFQNDIKFNKKSEEFISSPAKIARVTKNVDTTLTNESDSDSSKSDVPLQKYVDEKALEMELKSKNNKDSINVEKAEIKGLIQKRSNSHQTLNAKGRKSHKRVNKDVYLCEGNPPATEQEVNTNNNISVDETSKKPRKKRRRRTVAACNADMSSDLEQQLLSDKFMENFGFYTERIPRKSNLLASKKISETFHNMTSSDIEDSYVGYKEKPSKKSTNNEKKKSETIAEATTATSATTITTTSETTTTTSSATITTTTSATTTTTTSATIATTTTTIDTTVTAADTTNNFTPDSKPITEDDTKLIEATAESTAEIQAVTLISEETTHAMDVDDNNLDALAAQAIMDSDEIRNLENDLFSCLKEVAEAKLALKNTDMVQNNDIVQNADTVENTDIVQNTDVTGNTNLAHQQTNDFETINQDVQLNVPILKEDESCPKINDNSEANKTPKKIDKPSKQIGVKEKMYPDIEEFDMFEDKFDKIKRKRRSQAVAAKQVQTAVETNASAKSRKQTEKKRTTKSPKKNNQSTHVPTKGALKGFEGIKISIPTQDLTMPSNVSPPRQQKRRKKATKRRKTSESDGSYSDIDEKEKNVSIKDIYEFKDSEDTELFDLRPSTVMDRFRSMHNKNKFRYKERDRAKGDMEKEKQKVKAKERKSEVKEREKAREQEKYTDNCNLKQQNIMDVLPEDTRFVEKDITKDMIYDVDVKQLVIEEECEKLNKNKSTQEDDDSNKVIHKSAVSEELAPDANESLNKKETDGAVPSTSGFVHDRIDESDYESEISSPEGEFIFYTSDDVNCVCPSDNDSDESDVEKGCGRLNCMYKNRNADKKAAIGNIFKNNAVRCEKTDTKEPVKPRPDLDRLFDSLFETRPNDDEMSSEQKETASEDLLLSRDSSDSHDRMITTKSPHHNVVKSKQECTVSPNKEEISFCDDNFGPTGDQDITMIREIAMSEKKKKGGHNTEKCDLITNDVEMSDADSLHVFTNDDKTKNNFGYSLVSEECTQVNFADIIAHEIAKNEANDKNVIKTRDLKLKTSTPEQLAKYDSEDEFDIDKPESLTRQYMHFVMPADKASSCAQTENKSDNSDSELDNESAAAKYLKGFSPSEAAKLEIYTMVSAESTQTIIFGEDDPSKNKDTQSKGEDEAEGEVKNDDDNVLDKLLDSALKEPDSGGSTSIFNEVNDVSPPENSDSFATPASRSMEKHSPRKSDEGISTSHDYSVDAFDQSSFEDAGVARQRARRKCTVGKQNVLVEHWSSESEFDGVPARPNSADSVVATVSRRKKSRKKEGHHSGGKRGSRHSKGGGRRGGRSDDSDGGSGRARAPPGPKMRARPAHHYWSSDSEDSAGPQPQHGWIVGDSHKKLVTMLAHAKGRKRSNGDKLHSRFC